MKHILLATILGLLPLTVSAGTVTLKAQCSAGGEYAQMEGNESSNENSDENSNENENDDENEVAQYEGWTVTTDEYGDTVYAFEETVDASQLPIQKYLGELSVTLSKTGLLEVGMSVGDADASADASLQLPTKNEQLLPIEVLKLTASGGDHASGMWYFNCSTEVSVK